MNGAERIDLELNIARARVLLCAVAWLSIYVDPATPELASRLALTVGAFTIDFRTAAILAAHLAYGIATYAALVRRRVDARLPTVTTVLDVAFAAAVTLFTEGSTSPALAFFAFAISATGCRAGFRATLAVTLGAMVVYGAVIFFLAHGAHALYVMRPAYLAVMGYLIGFLGQQRVNLESRIRALETASQRHGIARSLHDSYVQGLAAFNLRLQSCRELLVDERSTDALTEMTELQRGVAREFDEVRTFIRALADVDDASAATRHALGLGGAGGDATVDGAPAAGRRAATRFRVHADFVAADDVLEQALHVMLEAMRNTRRHAGARSATIDAALDGGVLRIAIADDGAGFGPAATPPWSIASRVAEVGGHVRIAAADLGAHLEIEMPAGGRG